MLGIDFRRTQRRSHIRFRCTEGSNASAEGAWLCYGLGRGNICCCFVFKQWTSFHRFGCVFVYSPAVFAAAFAVVMPIQPGCYHCLRIHIFVWKKCATVDKRHIAPQGDPVVCGHWNILCALWTFW